MSLSYYSRLRPYYATPPAQRFRCLVSALDETCGELQQQVQSLCELPLLEDKKQMITSKGICQIMVQSLENITNSVNTTQISPDTVTEEQLHYLKFDLHTWVSSICGCVTVLKHLAQQDIHSNHDMSP